jgi:hypothetical protein
MAVRVSREGGRDSATPRVSEGEDLVFFATRTFGPPLPGFDTGRHMNIHVAPSSLRSTTSPVWRPQRPSIPEGFRKGRQPRTRPGVSTRPTTTPSWRHTGRSQRVR